MRAACLLALIVLIPGSGLAQSVPLPPQRPKPQAHASEAPRSFAEAVAGLGLDPAAVTSAPSDCLVALDALAVIDPLPRLIGPGACGGSDMVRLHSIYLRDKSRVAVNPPVTLRCEMAAAFATYLRDEVVTVFAGRRLASIDGAGGYECRGRNRIVGAKVSEHGKGNAIDIHSAKFTDGTSIFPTDLLADKPLREKLKASACARFATVLGPGSDGYHEEHIHLDIAARRGGYKMCQWDVRDPPPPGALAGPVPLPRPRPDPDAPAVAPGDDQ